MVTKIIGKPRKITLPIERFSCIWISLSANRKNVNSSIGSRPLDQLSLFTYHPVRTAPSTATTKPLAAPVAAPGTPPTLYPL